MYRESVIINNVYKCDFNEENWWKGNMIDILFWDFVKFCVEICGGRWSDIGLVVLLFMILKDIYSGWIWIDIYLIFEFFVNEV